MTLSLCTPGRFLHCCDDVFSYCFDAGIESEEVLLATERIAAEAPGTEVLIQEVYTPAGVAGDNVHEVYIQRDASANNEASK